MVVVDRPVVERSSGGAVEENLGVRVGAQQRALGPSVVFRRRVGGRVVAVGVGVAEALAPFCCCAVLCLG